MFVRFRKLRNNGVMPFAARAGAAVFRWESRCETISPGWVQHRRNQRRWVIGPKGPGLELVPYRIKVMLVENTRVEGKVKQEIIAVLGSMNATWLESFWEPMPDPALRHEQWEYFSLSKRAAFWDGVLARMSEIGDNRLNKDDRVAVRRAIHKVVPWVMEPERKRLELLEAQKVYQSCRDMHEWAESHVALDQEMIKRHTELLKESQANSAEYAQKVLQAGMQIAKLTTG